MNRYISPLLGVLIISCYLLASVSSNTINTKRTTSKTVGSKNKTVGILYEAWHGPASNAMREIGKKYGASAILTAEDVIRSAGNKTMNDILAKYNATGSAANFYWQARPQLGLYCIYKKRDNETSGYVPDCDNIEDILSQHAKWLSSAGVDFIAIDATNLPTLTPFADCLQLRPAEIIAEEWNKLRQQGLVTPYITMWPTVRKGATIWRNYLDQIYNNPDYTDLIYKDPETGKMVMFYVGWGDVDMNIVKQIQSNAGRNNILAVPMWAEFGTDLYQTGLWSFFSPCTVDNGTKYTSSMIDNDNTGKSKTIASCNQYETTHADIGASGTETTVSPAYQINYGSLFGGNPGKLGGITHLLLWEKVFQTSPDFVFISSWNEWISQPQTNPYQSNPAARTVGLEGDPFSVNLWVDTWGAEYSRDIEPSVEYGSTHLDIMSSCIQIFKKGSSCYDPSFASSQCCTLHHPENTHTSSSRSSSFEVPLWNNVWALTHEDPSSAATKATATQRKSDFLVTTNKNELKSLLSSGWRQICTPFVGPSVFCVNSTEPLPASGPFMILASGHQHPLFSTSASSSSPSPASSPQLTALYRCYNSSAFQHFISIDEHCEQLGQMETVIGYLSTAPSSLTPRRLHRCWNHQPSSAPSSPLSPLSSPVSFPSSAGWSRHSLDVPCSATGGSFLNDHVLGFVR